MKSRLAIVLGMLLVTPLPVVAAGNGAAVRAPRFVEETKPSGIRQVYDGEFEFVVGGGVAAFDCSGDLKPELYFAGGINPAALYRNESAVGGTIRFSHLPDPATDLTSVTGAYPLDIDGDSLVDLAVLRLGENVLLRGLGDCRFEQANDLWGFQGGDAWTTAFSARWDTSSALPTLAFGNYVQLNESGAPDGCEPSVLVRPDSSGTTYGAPVSLRPAFCALSVLFSDWDRTGRRDLRVSNDRHYYDESVGQEQLWRIDPEAPPRLYTNADGWERLVIWGMGIASQDLTGDGFPEVYLTNMGDNKLQTLADGPGTPAYELISLERGVTATKPFTGPDQDLPSTAWHAQFEDVNNDGLMDLFVAKGNVEAMPDFAAKDPSNLMLGRPDGTFVERAKQARILSYARGRGAAVVDLNLDGLLDLVEVNRRENVKAWRNVGSGNPKKPKPMGSWLALRLAQDDPNRDAIGSWIEVRTGDGMVTREVTVGGGHASGQLGWIHFGLGAAKESEVRVQWPDGTWGEWMSIDANGFAVIDRGVGGADTLDAMTTESSTRARLSPVVLPDFGMPDSIPEIPASTYLARVEGARARMAARGYDHLVIYADREHSANLAWLSGFDPRFEEAVLVLGRAGEPAILVGNECFGMAGAAPLTMRRHLFQDLSLPAQPRDRSKPLGEILGAEGIEPGSVVGVIGWKSFAQPAMLDVPSYLADCLRELAGPDGRVENATDLLIDPQNGLRTVNEVEQLAALEYASCQTSSGIRNLLFGLRPGMTEQEAVRLLGWNGMPLSCHLMLTAGSRATLGLLSPSDRVIEQGDRFTTAFGVWGALTCRAGFVVEDRTELPAGIDDYVERLVAPYFEAVCEWYGALRIGATGGELQAIIDRRLGDPFFGIFLNPGHLIGLDEWVTSPVAPGSTVQLRSGMAMQVDIIPATGTEYFTTNIEDGIALADAELREALADRYPGAWGRIQARRAFMADALGIELHPDVLPFSNIPAWLPPFLLRPDRVMTMSA